MAAALARWAGFPVEIAGLSAVHKSFPEFLTIAGLADLAADTLSEKDSNMGASSFGQHFVVTTFGESHGAALGVVIDGCPAGIPFCRIFCKANFSGGVLGTRPRRGKSDFGTRGTRCRGSA